MSKVKNRKTYKKVCGMFKVNNKETRRKLNYVALMFLFIFCTFFLAFLLLTLIKYLSARKFSLNIIMAGAKKRRAS